MHVPRCWLIVSALDGHVPSLCDHSMQMRCPQPALAAARKRGRGARRAPSRVESRRGEKGSSVEPLISTRKKAGSEDSQCARAPEERRKSRTSAAPIDEDRSPQRGALAARLTAPPSAAWRSRRISAVTVCTTPVLVQLRREADGAQAGRGLAVDGDGHGRIRVAVKGLEARLRLADGPARRPVRRREQARRRGTPPHALGVEDDQRVAQHPSLREAGDDRPPQRKPRAASAAIIPARRCAARSVPAASASGLKRGLMANHESPLRSARHKGK